MTKSIELQKITPDETQKREMNHFTTEIPKKIRGGRKEKTNRKEESDKGIIFKIS
jgi:hypothetical protein